MAKKLTEFTFEDLNAELKDINPLGSIMEHSSFSEVTEWIDTGNYHLNACVSGSLFGGWPNSRTCSIAGPSGTGKTFLVLNSVRKAIEMGYNVIYFDSEAAVDKDQMEKFGIDVTKVNYQPINTVQEFRTSVTTITSKMQDAKAAGGNVPKIMIILDTAGKKPWEITHLDTMELWKFGDFKAYTSLALLCHVFNIPTPKDDISGADVARVYFEEKDLERIKVYCEKDVVALIQLFLRMRGDALVDECDIHYS